ncbi:MAG: anthranilate synthase component I family protein, partial [Sediminibacterium sp.]|nr:anthranilate synthase component I family protein [Sediminibacterium sp.]
MKKIELKTQAKRMLADIYTPVGIYLRLRDKYRDTILLESTDHHAAENSYSFIAINAIAGIEVTEPGTLNYKFPGEESVTEKIVDPAKVPDRIWEFMQNFSAEPVAIPEAATAQGLLGYTAYDAIPFFETLSLKVAKPNSIAIPLMRYRLYQYVIVFNHFKDEIIFCENLIPGIAGDAAAVISLIRSKDVPEYPFATKGVESSNLTDEDYRQMVQKGIAHCMRGDVFQVVLSRRFEQRFQGDEFNVYRSLRSVNPSPYLFFFDYGTYKLMGSSPEAQLIVKNQRAVVHPIAGTFRRTGDEATDQQMAANLLADAKENAEHIMLV